MCRTVSAVALLVLPGVATLGAQQRDSSGGATGAASRARAAVQPMATVEGRVIRPSLAGEIPVPGVMVTMHRVGSDSAGPLDSLRTDADGAYRFRFRRWGSESAVYFAAAVHHGIAYFSTPFRGLATRDHDAEIVVFDTTSTPIPLTVQGHHLVVAAPRPTGARDIVEVYEVSNDTIVTVVGRDSMTAVWSAPLPPGATNFAAGQGDVSASSLIERDGRVLLLAPVGPGVKQLSYSYTLAPRSFPLTLTLDRANALLEVLLEEPGAQVRGGTLTSQGNVTTEGRTLKRFLAQNAPAGTVLRIDVPSNAISARATVVVVLAAGFVLAMVAALWFAMNRRTRAPAPVAAIAVGTPDQLVAEIAVLDARREQGDHALTEDEYSARRAALKARLASALAGGSAKG
jgi:hypothetical protein